MRLYSFQHLGAGPAFLLPKGEGRSTVSNLFVRPPVGLTADGPIRDPYGGSKFTVEVLPHVGLYIFDTPTVQKLTHNNWRNILYANSSFGTLTAGTVDGPDIVPSETMTMEVEMTGFSWEVNARDVQYPGKVLVTCRLQFTSYGQDWS